jgi:5-(carboxyamino)imidazole ribonucleotide synthase
MHREAGTDPAAPASARTIALPGAGGASGGPATLGVLGGGQLGRMFVQAAQRLGYRTVVLEPDPDSPAGGVAHEHLLAAYDDEAALSALAQRCDAVTTEFENVPAPALALLERVRPVAPAAEAVAICQHRAREKAHFLRCGVPCVPHAAIERAADLDRVDPAELLPGILKSSTLGYDGKGQVRVATAGELAAAWSALGRVPCLLERRVELRAELSVIVARERNGRCVHLPVQQNLHRDGILAVTQVPAPDIPAEAQARAVDHARAIAASMRYVGVLCVEFFLLADGSVVANEMAPRPHNSGHYSIEACDLSQFELQVRTLAGLPLAEPRLHSPAVMLNLLGDLWLGDGDDQPATPPWDAVLALPGTHLHLYGKRQPRRGRKMGHLTVSAGDAAAARAVALQAAARLGIAPF